MIDPYREPSEDLDDDAFLDRVFETVLRAAEGGEDPDLRALFLERRHLEARGRDLLLLARDVAAYPQCAPTTGFPSVSGYRVLRKLGEGGTGAVFLASQEAVAGRKVALKILRPGLLHHAGSRERFRREVASLTRVDHPNVVKVYDLTLEGPVLAFAMQWVDGATLAHLISVLGMDSGDGARETAKRDLGTSNPTEFFLNVGIRIAHALEALHQAGLVHRDVKPGNILLARSGQVFLSDFGLARDPADPTGTVTGDFVGTLAYASPEMLRGDHHKVDGRADVYGLGATLYHVFTGRLPNRGGSAAQILWEIENQSAQRRFRSGIPRDLRVVLTKALDPDPARRFQKARELAFELERIAEGKPIQSRSTWSAERAVKAAWANRSALRAFVAVILLLLVAVGGMALRTTSIRAASRRAEAEWRLGREVLVGNLDFDQVYRLSFPGAIMRLESSSQPTHATALKAALAHFDRAANSAPSLPGLEVERAIVRVAHAILSKAVVPRGAAESLDNESLVLGEFARGLIQGTVTSGLVAQLHRSAESERRHAGLLSFLAGRPDAAAEAWAELGKIPVDDPLTNTILGAVFLMQDRPERAADKFHAALERLPDSRSPDTPARNAPSEAAAATLALRRCEPKPVRFSNDRRSSVSPSAAGPGRDPPPSLPDRTPRPWGRSGGLDSEPALVMAANADLRRGERIQAERIIDRIEEENAELGHSALHVRANLLWLHGEFDRAKAIFDGLLARHRYQALLADYALMLECRGDLQGALNLLTKVVEIWPGADPYVSEFARTAKRWWADLDRERQFELLERSLEYPYFSPESLPGLLCEVQRCNFPFSETLQVLSLRRVARDAGRIQAGSGALATPSSSESSGSVSLTRLAWRMNVMNLDLSRASLLNDSLRDSLARLLLEPVHGLAEPVVWATWNGVLNQLRKTIRPLSKAIAPLMAIPLLATGATAQVWKEYDPARGLPDGQGFWLERLCGVPGCSMGPPPSIQGGVLHMGPSQRSEYTYYQAFTPETDFVAGAFTLEADVNVISSTFEGSCDRAGFQIGVGDSEGRFLYVMISATNVYLRNDNCGSIGTGLDTRRWNNYRLEIQAGIAELYVNSTLLLTLPVGTGPATGCGIVAFGDITLSAQSEVEIARIRYSPFQGIHASACSISASAGGRQELWFESQAHAGMGYAHALTAQPNGTAAPRAFPFRTLRRGVLDPVWGTAETSLELPGSAGAVLAGTTVDSWFVVPSPGTVVFQSGRMHLEIVP